VTQKIDARIGMINFINTAPLYEVWQQTVHRPEWRIVEATPAVLNRLLYEDQIDLGIVSSHEYVAHPRRYRILPDLSITASGPVGSVFLFSRVPVKKLSGHLVLLSDQSQTSVHLVKIILEEFYKVKPKYLTGNVAAADPAAHSAALAIGDDALRLYRAGSYAHVIDLGEVWHNETGLPFVFAVWAVQEEFYLQKRETLAAIHRELKRCLVEGKQRLAEICAVVAPRIPMAPEACYDYLKAIEYDLGPDKLKALEVFFGYVIKRGEGDAQALPLKMAD